MKKRSLIFGIAVFVGMALIFSGCEQETKTEYITNTVTEEAQGFLLPDNAVEVDSEAVLVALLADESGVYNDIAYAAAPSAAVTVPAGKTLYLDSGSSGLTLAADLTVAGKLVVYGGSLTPGTYLKGTGTLELEIGGTLTVTDDTLFTGTASLGAVNIKKGAILTAVGATVDSAAKVTAWVRYAGSGLLLLNVTTITPKVTLDAIGTRSETNFVTVINNVAPAAAETSLTVPTGVNLTTSDTLATLTSLTVDGTLTATSATLAALTSLTVDGTLAASSATLAALTSLTVNGILTAGSNATFAALTSLTVNGTFTAGSNATFGAAAGVTIKLGSKAKVAGLGAIAKLAASVTVPAGAEFDIRAGITDFDDKTVTVKAGNPNIISDIDLVFSGYDSASKSYILNDSIALTAKQNIFIPEGTSFTVKAGKTITNAGTITLGEGSSLVLTGADGTGGAKLTGAGKLVAANTEITGEWQAVGASGTVTITATDADASVITGATSVLTASTGGTITQNAAASNNLTIATGTTIALGGIDAKVGEIVLKNSSAASVTDNGKLTLIGTITTGNTAGTNQSAGAVLSTDGTTVVSSTTAYTKIGVANLAGDGTIAKVAATNDPESDGTTSAAGKIAKLIGAASATITGGDTTDTVDGTKDGKISGETATAADATS